MPPFSFVTGRFPVTSAPDKSTALLVTVCVLPAKCAMPAPGEDATTHVVQVSVPDPVIVPPPRGEVVAILVTVPTGTAPPSAIIPPLVPENVAMCPLVADAGPTTTGTAVALLLLRSIRCVAESAMNPSEFTTLPCPVVSPRHRMPLPVQGGGEAPADNDVPLTAPVDATELGVIAPRVSVIAGVVVAVATEPETPFAGVTETEVTVPEPPPPPPLCSSHAYVAAAVLTVIAADAAA